jgi:peptide chain release factor 3
MAELNDHLGMPACPMNWPVWSGHQFRGVYDRATELVHLWESEKHGSTAIEGEVLPVLHPGVAAALGQDGMKRLQDDLELLDVAGDALDVKRVLRGELSPLYFGSALNNFGVEPFLRSFLELAPPPGPRLTESGPVDPHDLRFSGFVFKIQANMNTAHRDRIAFVRICSGRFARGMEVYNPRLKREVRMSNPAAFMARERTLIEEAYPGDIVGLYDPGVFRVGDSLTQGQDLHFGDIPHFSPEIFRRVRVRDALQRKALIKGLSQLAEEGAIQLYSEWQSDMFDVLGAVGVLQFDVLAFRLEKEYRVTALLEGMAFSLCRWLVSQDPGFDATKFKRPQGSMLAKDRDGHPVVLFPSAWGVSWAQEQNPKVELLPVSPVAQHAGALTSKG